MDIAELSAHFQGTFVDHDPNELKANAKQLNDAFEARHLLLGTAAHPVTEDEVESVIRGLSTGRSAGWSTLSNEHVKHGLVTNLLHTITNLMDIMIRQGVIPADINLSVVKPILKNKKLDKTKATSYRPISLCETLANIYEALLLRRINQQ